MAESGMYVYVSHQGARQISVYRMSLSGELTKVQDLSVPGKAMPMAVSPDRRFLFIALRTEPYSIASFAIDGANGTLTHLGDAPAPNSAPYISTDRTGRFLLGAYNPEAEPAGRRVPVLLDVLEHLHGGHLFFAGDRRLQFRERGGLIEGPRLRLRGRW